MSDFAVIIVAAGKSSRFGDPNYKKPFAMLGGRAVWLHSAERFLNRADVKQVIVVISAEDREDFSRKFGANIAILGIDVCEGGADRADSVAAGLAKVNDKLAFVAIHDAARPCVTDKSIDKLFEATKKTGAAILATPVSATLKKVASGRIESTLPRTGVWAAATPQAFRREVLGKAYAARVGRDATDDAQLVEQVGQAVAVVEDSPLNIKITTRDDLKLAEQILKVLPKAKPEGFSHPFAGDDLFR